MKSRASEGVTVQAWVELKSQDPEAVSAFAVARANLAAARNLTSLRRLRCIELAGTALDATRVAGLLHRSTQFYNPHKERCTLRMSDRSPAPIAAEATAVMITERGAERMSAAERWWRHETGEIIQARQGVVWVMAFEGASRAIEAAEDLALLRDRHHGLLCNPHCQDYRVAGAAVPLPWLASPDTETALREVGHAGLDAG